ncbi:MAG TPA: protein phosphatase 2C domain-containing protein [Micromonosporaceae bacterium]|nr:protein phosphatase 2C domain-containing protein [Micromonosporaceae bacterium]
MSADNTAAGSEPASVPYGVSAPPSRCQECGGADIGPDGYCETCGTRRPAAAAHSEVDLGGIAGVSDIGARHHHNEDAMGLAAGAGVTAGVVCDGVSASSRPDVAAIGAAAAATEAFAARLGRLAAVMAPAASDGASEADAAGGTSDVSRPGQVVRTASIATLLEAGAAAQAGAARAAGPEAVPNPPSTTFAAAVVTGTDIAVGWVGDSRVYWLPDPGTPGEPACLTVDDTLAGQLAAAGVVVAADSPNAGALIRWLGTDAYDVEPHTATLAPDGPGRVIVCSDGLYRYAAEPRQLAEVAPAGRPIEVASALVRFALDAGGHDNVTVVVMPFPPDPDESAIVSGAEVNGTGASDDP